MNIVNKLKAKKENMRGASPVTVVFLGDSVTQGCYEVYRNSPTTIETVFDYDSAYSTRFKSMVNLLYPNAQLNIINSGISGDNAVGALARIERDALNYNPDLVVVGLALNDSTAGMEKLDEYRSAMTEIVKRVKNAGAECILLTPNMMNEYVSCHIFDDLTKNIAEGCKKVQVEGVLDAYVEVIRDIAKEQGVKLCDVYAKWKAMSRAGVDITYLLSNYINHPIRKLHYLTAMMLVDTIFED